MMRAAILGLALLAATVACAETPVLVGWEFDDDLSGWSEGSHVEDVRVSDGLFAGMVVDWDPQFATPTFDIEAKPWQRIEIRMLSEKGGGAEFFWTNTLDTPHQGFTGGKETRFEVYGDGEFHTYAIHPFWHAEGKIIRLRFDLPRDSGAFAVDWIRIVDGDREAASRDLAWQADGGDVDDWFVAEGIDLRSALRGKTLNGAGSLIAPTPPRAGDPGPWASIRMRVSGGVFGSISFALRDRSGMTSVRFPLRADGELHAYNVDLSQSTLYGGDLLAVGLQPTDAEGAIFEIDSVAITDYPVGAPEIEITHAGPADAVPRTGQANTYTCMFINHGGETAEGTASVRLPKPLRLARGETRRKPIIAHFALPTEVSWRVTADRPCDATPTVTIKPATGEAATATGLPLVITEAPTIAAASYVPEPVPAETNYQIGSYYFPGWYAMGRWQPVKDTAPERRPALGWYDEADPEIVDWQIKWAAEHGVSFFMVDWYWTSGGRSLDHWLHDGYMKARWRRYMKFALMWANHNAAGTHSMADWRDVTQYWIENYFGLDEYLTIDGKPAVFIWAPANIRRDVGGSGEAETLYAMSQEMARAAGLEGITFVAMGDHPDEAHVDQLAAEGYTSATSYHWWGDATELAEDAMNFPFELVARTSKTAWERHDEMIDNRMGFIPCVDTGWASQPWHGHKARVIHDRTPDHFEKICRDARDFVDERGQSIVALGPWNEWGEGSYIEPCVEFGFDMLDAVRRAFCKTEEHLDITPADVGLGPYDFPQTQDQTVWEFEKTGEGWGPFMGMGDFRIVDGAMHCVVTHSDPAFTGPVVTASALRHPRVLIRMKIDKVSGEGETGQLFWETVTTTIGEANSARFELIADNKYHDYIIDMAAEPRWRGIIRGFRFDPCGTPGARISIDRFELLTN